MPKFSVQVCCYNSELYLADTIESIVSQTFTDWELVIINDGSKDRTEEIVKRYEKKGVPIVYFSQENKGFAAARNKAVELSKGEWIAILDHDDLWYPRKLQLQNDAISRHPGAKLHFANSEWFLDSGSVVRRTLEAGRFASGILNEAFDKLLAEGCFIDSETAVINRAALLDCGGFNERYAYIVDFDMFIRLAEKYPVCYEDSILAKWRMHKRQASNVMKATMFEEYVLMFEDVLKRYGLSKDARRKIKDEIVSNSLKYSLTKLRGKEAGKSLEFAIKRMDPYSMARFAAIKAPRAAFRKACGFLRGINFNYNSGERNKNRL